MDNLSMNNFYSEVRQILQTRDIPSSYGKFERTCEEIQAALQLAITLSRDYVTMSHEVFSAALNILSQHRQLEADLTELAILRERLTRQLSALKLSEERNIKWLELLRSLSQKLEVYRRENHAISEGTLKIIERLSKDKLRLDDESDLTKRLHKISKQIVRGDEPFSMKILTRLKRLEYHHAISQDVSALQLIFSRMLMRRNVAVKESGSMFSCFGGQRNVNSCHLNVVDLLSKIITIGTTLLAEVQQLQEVNRLMRARQDLMYREYMDRQNNTHALLWEIQMITSELHALDEKNDRIVGKIVKTRPDFETLEEELERVVPQSRRFSRRIVHMHPDLFDEPSALLNQQPSSSSEGDESLVDKALYKDQVHESVIMSPVPETVIETVPVSDVKFNEQQLIESLSDHE